MNTKNYYDLGFDNIYKYATFNCEKAFSNDSFDALLIEIGKYCFDEKTGNYHSICRLIQASINKDWHLNKLRRRSKKVSIRQIKTIRHSFKKVGKDEQYIRIPFDVIPIFFYILSLAKSIDSENSNVHSIINKLNEKAIGNGIYKKHIEIFEFGFYNRVENLNDQNLKEKYKILYSQLLGSDAFMRKKFNQINWNDSEQYKI